MKRRGMLVGLMIAIGGIACSPAPGGLGDEPGSDPNAGGTASDTNGTDPVVLMPNGDSNTLPESQDAAAPGSPAPSPSPSPAPADGGMAPSKADGGAPAPTPPPPAPAACPGKNEIEPNDATANALAGITCGKLTAGDVDRFQFDALDNVSYTLAFDADQGARFRIVRPNGTTISTTGRTVRASFSGRAGRIDVIVDSAAVAQSYRITLTRN